MDLEFVIAEGQRLAKPAALLTVVPSGPVVGRWYGYDAYEVDEYDNFCILTIDAKISPEPQRQEDTLLSLFVDETNCESGFMTQSSEWPDFEGLPLFAHVEQVPAPLHAILKFGSRQVQDWLNDINWELDESSAFYYPYHEAPDRYFSMYTDMHPLYREDVFAMVGGWHYPFPDNDWFENLDSYLSLMTIRDSEPWIEAWQRPKGQYDVLHRVT